MNNIISKRESEVITLLKTLAIIGVVLIHTPKPIQIGYIEPLMHSITLSSVPIFFLLSGLFLFRKDIEELQVALSEIKKRIRTLFIPFIFWNTLIILLSLTLLYFAPSLSKDGAYTINHFSFNSINSTLWGINRHPIHYQFWFIRNLMIFVILSPLFKILLKKSPWIGLVLSFILHEWINGALFFFIGGIIITYSSSKIFVIRKPLITVILSLVIFFISIFIKIPQSALLLTSFTLILAIANIKNISFALHGRTNSISNYLFFIYATHEPLITFLDKIVDKVIENSSNLEIVKFLLFPFIAILLTWFLGIILKKYTKNIYNFSTGMR